MTSERIAPATATPKVPLFRVGRGDDPLRFATIDAADAMLPNAGNRFDVPGRGVLYLATDEETCFIETLARFRPSPKFRAMAKDNPSLDPHFMIVGGVPADWRSCRLIVECAVDSDALPFLDVDAVETAEFLNWALADELHAHDLPLLDHSTILGPNRLVTRLIASWASSATNENGELLYSGIRYGSRLDQRECWAVFEGTPVQETSRDTISVERPALVSVAEKFSLRLF